MAKHYADVDYVNSRIHFSPIEPEDKGLLWVNEGYSPTGKTVDLLKGVVLYNSYISDIDGNKYKTSNVNEYCTGDTWLNVENIDVVTFTLTQSIPEAPVRGGVQGYDKGKKFIRTVLPHQPSTEPFSVDIDVRGIDLIKPNLYFGNEVKYTMTANISPNKVPVLFLYNKSSGQWEDVSGLKYVFDMQFKQARAITGINVDPEVTGNVTELMYYLHEAKNKLPEYVRNAITSMSIYEKANDIFAYSNNELGGLYFNNYYQDASPDRLFVTNLVYHEVSHNVDALSYVRDESGEVVNSLSRDDTFKPVYDALGFTSTVYEAFAEVMNWYYTYKLGYVDYDYYENMDIIVPYMERVERSGYKLPLVK